MFRTILASTLLSGALALPAPSSTHLDRRQDVNCFPYGTATLPTDYSAPNVSRDQWFCPHSMEYGFQGFSYPLEDSDCSAYSNSYDSMDADFAEMKSNFGASIVRVYYPACTDVSVFENLIKAAVDNNMAVIPQVWFGFDNDNSVFQASRDALYAAMDGQYSAIAPYVFHSADFGSEPIGDQVDNGSDQFISDLAEFKSRMNGYGIPTGISEDWDRPGIMSGSDGTGLADVGQRVLAQSDYIHTHIMPFYHGNLYEDQTWDYIQGQLQYYNQTIGKPHFITETQWAREATDHYQGHVDVGVTQYTAYWQKYDEECETFKTLNVGWFLHDWYGDGAFDYKYDDGSYVLQDYKPRQC